MKEANIIVINYNDKKRVQRAIESALNQTWQNTKVIVVDDGSDDETRGLYAKYGDSIRLVQLERDDLTARTPSRARNAGLGVCSGDYVAVLDSDNYLEKAFVEEMIKVNADVAYCDWEIIGLTRQIIEIAGVWNRGASILQNYLKHTHLDHQCLLMKREYLDKCGWYDERLPRSQDCDLIVRLMLQGGKWEHIQKNLFKFEQHEQDQMKSIASIHGKTLWTLKNNINIQWLVGRLSDPAYIIAMHQGINDFCALDIWKEEFDKSEFKNILTYYKALLTNERSEKV